MNSDPTGNFTLFQMSVAINVQNQLRNTYNSAILDGFVGFLDALLGGEKDPMALLSTFVEGVNTGFITGAIFGGISAMANMGCKAAKIAVMLKIGMAGFGVVGGAISTVQSFQEGKNAQGVLRGVITSVGTVGFAKTIGSGVATAKSCENSTTSSSTVSRKTDFYVKPNGEAVPATGYRYMDSKYADQTIKSMSATGSYFGFKKFDSATAAQDAFQISSEWSNCKLRGEFDTLQVIDEMYIPKAYGDKGPGLEPFTRCYPEYGKGGCQQFIYKGIINFKDVTIIGD